MKRREHGGFVPSWQMELMIVVAVAAVLVAMVVSNVLKFRARESRRRAIEQVVSAERAWRTQSGEWFAFDDTQSLQAGLGVSVEGDCELSGVAEEGTRGALLLSARCPSAGGMPFETRVEP